jgi:hypothetical protein
MGAAGTAAAADSHSAMQFTGTGAQVYICSGSGDHFAWTLKAPDATLTDASKKAVGKHFAGPTWRANDGSSVVGEAVANSPSPRRGAIPWLVLRAKSHSGSGIMADVAYVVRANTRGGVAPASGCDAAHSGSEKRAPYSAQYLFFPGSPQK